MAIYCHDCGAVRQYLNPPPTDPLATAYQLGKYMKHTVADRAFRVQSVFNTRSTQTYEGYIIDALAAGAVEIDRDGRTNLIWAAGKDVGFRFEAGQQLVIPQDAVKVVLSSDAGKVHAFSVPSSDFTGSRCPDCGRWAIVA